MLKKIFKHFGYSLSKIKKSQNLDEIIKFRLQNNPCELLIDVGANQGDFSKNYLDNFKELFLFEPNKNLMNNFSDINREIKEERNHPADLDAKINSIYYYFPSGGGFRVSCFDWSIKMQTEKNWYDHIKVSGFTEEILQWFINEAY